MKAVPHCRKRSVRLEVQTSSCPFPCNTPELFIRGSLAQTACLLQSEPEGWRLKVSSHEETKTCLTEMDCGRMKCMKQDVNDFAHEDAWKSRATAADRKNKTKIGWMKNQVTVFTAWPLTGQNQLRYEEDFTRLSKICCFAYNANQHCRTYNTDRPLKEIT